jgi:hypothetical protein
MKVSLRKANALQLLINEQINEGFVGTTTISKYDVVSDALQIADEKLAQTIAKKFSLIEVLYSLRTKVGEASASAGIAKLLTELALNEKTSAFLKQLASTTAFALDAKTISAIIADAVAQKDSYGRSKDAVTVSLLTKETVEKYKSDINKLRKAKQSISDKLLHLNVSTEIELDEKEVSVLKKYEIL